MVLLTVGYDINLKRDLLVPVTKTILLRLLVSGVLLLFSNLIVFSLFPFDKELEVALMVLYSLPAPFYPSYFSRRPGEDGEYVSTSLSVYTLVTVALFAAIVVYSVA